MTSNLYRQPAGSSRRMAGVTLIELLAVMVMIGILTAIAVPPLWGVLEQVKVTRAIADIEAIQIDLMSFEVTKDSLPADLNAIGRGSMLDPWGNPYQYLGYLGQGSNPPGVRMDRSLHPLNSDFDLYSMGADGASAAPITAMVSQDDIIRANDGGYIGLARNY